MIVRGEELGFKLAVLSGFGVELVGNFDVFADFELVGGVFSPVPVDVGFHLGEQNQRSSRDVDLQGFVKDFDRLFSLVLQVDSQAFLILLHRFLAHVESGLFHEDSELPKRVSHFAHLRLDGAGNQLDFNLVEGPIALFETLALIVEREGLHEVLLEIQPNLVFLALLRSLLLELVLVDLLQFAVAEEVRVGLLCFVGTIIAADVALRLLLFHLSLGLQIQVVNCLLSLLQLLLVHVVEVGVDSLDHVRPSLSLLS